MADAPTAGRADEARTGNNTKEQKRQNGFHRRISGSCQESILTAAADLTWCAERTLGVMIDRALVRF